MVLLDGQVPMHYMVASLVTIPLSVRLSSSLNHRGQSSSRKD
uniref:Uncharacterized protein n=1 Tax=Nelumbo nucifera TaxID=4432 RepID=A0A822XJQ3_NELNU|nr:TPA_asm: hypothetical protein HUJ06_021980 [Nelumbo nucifera]